MENNFKILVEALLAELSAAEALTISLRGETSQFTRFSQSKIRQTGHVDEADLSMNLMKSGRRTQASLSLSGEIDEDRQRVLSEFNRLRSEIDELPEDLIAVTRFPKDP